MRNKRLLITLIGVMLAAAGLVLFATACSSKKTSNGADTPTAMATMAGETPHASTTPMASGTPQAGAVTVNLAEWKILPDRSSVPAGSVTFNVKNIGSEKHEFVLLKTDLAEDGLPTMADGSADESQLEKINEVTDLAAGGQGSFTANLVAGKYVLICNIVDTQMGHIHYKQGMHAAFTVTL